MRLLLLALASALAACSNAAASPCPCQASSPAGSSPIGPEHLGLPRSEKLEQLAQQRVELARKRLQLVRLQFDKGALSLDQLVNAFRDLAFAARDSGFHGEPLRHILKEYRDALAALRDLVHERADKGMATPDEAVRMDLMLAEAELWLGEADRSL
jgi:hypothetical protein